MLPSCIFPCMSLCDRYANTIKKGSIHRSRWMCESCNFALWLSKFHKVHKTPQSAWLQISFVYKIYYVQQRLDFFSTCISKVLYFMTTVIVYELVGSLRQYPTGDECGPLCVHHNNPLGIIVGRRISTKVAIWDLSVSCNSSRKRIFSLKCIRTKS